MRDVVVVGGSIAALTAVEMLRMEDFDGRITVLSDEDVPPYTRVPLSKGVLAGTESIDDVVLAPLADDVDLRLRTPATGLDLGDADRAHPRRAGALRRPGHRHRRARPPPRATPTRTSGCCAPTTTAPRLRDDLAAASSVLVVGGGFLGMEIASTARALGKDVTVVDVAPPLDRLLGAVVGGHVRSVAARAGVRIVVTDGGVRLLGSPHPHRGGTGRRHPAGGRPRRLGGRGRAQRRVARRLRGAGCTAGSSSTPLPGRARRRRRRRRHRDRRPATAR